MIFFSDMDGTFLTDDKAVSPASRRALDAIAAAGMEFVPCTGRAAGGIHAELLAHPAVRHIVSSNGAMVMELDEEAPTDLDRARVLMSSPLDRGRARAVWEIARRHDVTYDVFADGDCICRRDFFERVPEFVPDEQVARGMVETRTPVDEDPLETIARVRTLDRVAMYWKDPADRDAILEALHGIGGIDVTSSYPTNIEVMEAGVSKGSALAWLCGHLGLACADAVAFGDNYNDVEMLRTAGMGVAMANAEEDVRACADRVCASNAEDGVAATIMELLEA